LFDSGLLQVARVIEKGFIRFAAEEGREQVRPSAAKLMKPSGELNRSVRLVL
jgi:hypothetical protein